jgi:hypothetical protein
MGNLSMLQGIGLGSAATGVASSAVSGLGQYESGQEQKAADDYNAAITLQQMNQQMQTSEAKYSSLIGKQAASYARAGVDIASGSPLLQMVHTAQQSATEQESEYQAGTEESALQKYYGKLAAFSGTVGGISTFVSGLSKGTMQAASILGPSSSVPQAMPYPAGDI